MGYQDVAKGEEFERKAEKKIKGWGLFGGSKYEDAADLYQKAANSFKLSKSYFDFLGEVLLIGSLGILEIMSICNLHCFVGDRAAAAYIKLATCNLRSDSKHEAASAYVDSANCYKKTSPKQAISCLGQAVNLLLEINRFNMAARYCKEIGELYEKEQNMDEAMNYFERAAELFQTEEVNTSASQCKQKVAEFSTQLGKYQKAIDIYEEVARYSLNNNLLKYGARGHLLNAGICQLCKGDFVAINNALEKYQDLDPTFSRTRECKLLADLAVAFDEEDAVKFTIAVKEFDSMTKLDAWRTTLLLRVKENIKAKELEEDDLT